VQFGRNEARLKRAVQNSEMLFEKLKPLHRLDRHWLPYLTAATILRDVGEAVSFRKNEEHSYYVIKNSDFRSMDAWESEFVAQLCLHHEGKKINAGEIPFAHEKAKYSAFLKLLAILRVVDALDAEVTSPVAIHSVKIAHKEMRISFGRKAASDLELLRLERKKPLLEELFKKTLVVQKPA